MKMRESWMDPSEQEATVALLLEDRLIKFSNARDLPLKNGGRTDIYINLREARGHPQALKEMALTFENPLRRLAPHRFIEVPDSVSCFAPLIAEATSIPYLTIRNDPKEGRASKSARHIGDARFGETAVLFDDVITDGESKVIPFHYATRQLGLKVSNLIVLVDRQQGWQEHLAKQGINLNVWQGMTLHDVRRLLISRFGIMSRCNPRTEADNRLIVALDGKSWLETLNLADVLRTTGVILKVNDLAFDKGFQVVPELSVYGRVMIDLKGHDINKTVFNTCTRLKRHSPWAVTVHASGGREMIEAAKKALEGTDTFVLTPTVLTSIDPRTCQEIYRRRPLEQVMKLAGIAVRGGADGFVCSPEEVKPLRKKYPDKLIVPAAVRSMGVSRHDQARVGTPAAVFNDGANFAVMGRQILENANPVGEIDRLHREEIPPAA